MTTTLRKPAGIKAKCNALSHKLVSCWNRRTAVELDLRHRAADPARRIALEDRLADLCDEQDRLERQMTRLAEALVGEADA